MRSVLLPALALLLARAALAEEAEARPLSERVQLHGWVDAYYGFNFNRPAAGKNFAPGEGTTGVRANAFSLNQGVIEISAEPEPVGVQLAVGWGTGFEVLHASEPEGVGIGPQVWRHVLTAAIRAKVPVGRGLLLEGGILPSHLGFETFPSKDDWTYTRSHMGDFSPYYQAGIKATYAFTELFTAQLHLLNGWQLAGENNEGKALGVQLVWTWPQLTLTLNGFAGPELPHDGAHWRLFVDAIAQWQLSPLLTLVLVADAGRQSLPGERLALWYASQLDARFTLSQSLFVTLRAEVYRDRDGLITGTSQTLGEGTVCVDIRPWESLIVKLEGRLDHSTAAVFQAFERAPDGTPERVQTQPLLMAGVVAVF